MRRVCWLLLLLTACPKDDDGSGDGVTTPFDAAVQGTGTPDARPLGGDAFCLYTEITLTYCSGSGTVRDESLRCARVAELPSCPPPPDEDRVILDCLITHATIFEERVEGASCEAILEERHAAACARAGEGACEAAECEDGLDNNGNGLTDCEEPLCFAIGSGAAPGEARCRRPEDGVGRCMNLVDDDSDGLHDCADPDCAVVCAAEEGVEAESCLDEDPDGGIDNDGDGLANCDEPLCHDPRHGFLPCVAATEDCSNGADDDGDLRIDCGDPLCAERCATEEGLDHQSCVDGKDNDEDGVVDCDEPDCLRRAWACARPERCGDGVDNDHDDAIDGEDEECR
jgi:hypothetical protein